MIPQGGDSGIRCGPASVPAPSLKQTVKHKERIFIGPDCTVLPVGVVIPHRIFPRQKRLAAYHNTTDLTFPSFLLYQMKLSDEW